MKKCSNGEQSFVAFFSLWHLAAGAGRFPKGAAHIRVTGQDGVDGFEKVFGGLLLHHETIGAGTEYRKGEHVFVMHREHQNPCMRQTFAQLLDKLQAVVTAEGEIDDREVRVKANGCLGSLINVGRVSADHQVLPLIDQLSQRPAYEEIVIHDQDLGPGGRFRGNHSNKYCTFMAGVKGEPGDHRYTLTPIRRNHLQKMWVKLRRFNARLNPEILPPRSNPMVPSPLKRPG